MVISNKKVKELIAETGNHVDDILSYRLYDRTVKDTAEKIVYRLLEKLSINIENK